MSNPEAPDGPAEQVRVDPRVAWNVPAQVMLRDCAGHQGDQDFFHDLRGEWARWILSTRLVLPAGAGSDVPRTAWEAFCAAHVTHGLRLRLRCDRCHGRRVDLRRGQPCGECRCTGKRTIIWRPAPRR